MVLPHILSLQFFGGLRVERDTQTVVRFRTQKTAVLLVLLALKGKQSREKICTLLWPDANPESARNSLSVALSSLRRELGEDVLNTDRQDIALNLGKVITDVDAFNDALRSGDYAQAVDLYSGHFLPGFYEDPLPSLAREYEEKARHAINIQLELLARTSNFDKVFSLARRAIALFGNDERWFLFLMQAHYGREEFDAALRVYDSLQRWNTKNGDSTSETARQIAKSVRRAKDQSKNAAPTIVAVSPSQYSPSIEPTQTQVQVKGLSELHTEAKTEVNLVNLPSQWTRFFGRLYERDVLTAWLNASEKLITLSGSGGSGKTRLAIEVARQIAEESESKRICFVSLASLSDPALLLSTIREALGLSVAPDLPLLEQLELALRGQECLLVLDNFEQLAPEGTFILQALREKLSRTTFIVTSRVLLRLPGERELPLAPLPTPLVDTSMPDTLACPSVALFCDRANIHIDEASAGHIGTLCRRLDGIPLALELAAARAKVLSPLQIVERLERHPNFLESREVGIPARHKTLRTAIEWSVDLLSPQLRDFFVRLCVFQGGWTLEAAETIIAPGVCTEWDTLDLLTQLRDCSLILTEEGVQGTRFRMLVMLREWGQSQLNEEQRADLERRHFQFFLSLAERELDSSIPPELSQEIPNLRAALAFGFNQREASEAARLAGALCSLWESHALFSEGYEWTEHAIRHTQSPVSSSVSPQIIARLLFTNSTMHWYSGNRICARERLREALSLYESLEDENGQAQVLILLGRMEVSLGDCNAGVLSGERAIAIARRLDDSTCLASALVTASWGLVYGGYPRQALPLLDEAVSLRPQDGSQWILVLAHSARVVALFTAGEIEASIHEREYLLNFLEDQNEDWVKSLAQWHIGTIDCWEGRLERARLLLGMAIRTQHAIGSRWDIAYNFYSLGELALRMGDYERGTLLLSASESICERTGYNLLPFVQSHRTEALRTLDAATTQDQKLAWWAQGRRMSVDEAFAITQTFT